MCQILVKVTGSRYLLSQCNEVKHSARFSGCRSYIWGASKEICVKVTGVQSIGQGHQVKVPAKSVHREEALYKVWWLRPYSWGHMEGQLKRCKSQLSAKYRSKSPSQGTCRVRTLRRSNMQGLVVVGLIGDIEHGRKMCKMHWSAKYRSRSPGQDTCRVSTSKRSTIQGLVARGLYIWGDLERWRKLCQSHCSQNIGQDHQVMNSAESVHWKEAFCKVWWL